MPHIEYKRGRFDPLHRMTEVLVNQKVTYRNVAAIRQP